MYLYFQLTFDEFERLNPLKSDNLLPRRSVFGGRTGCIALMVEVDDVEYDINFRDVVSLYPAMQLGKPLPKGAFKRLTAGLIPSDIYTAKRLDVFGLYYCVVLPDQSLFMPVLPTRINERLVFTNCFTCASIADHSKDICDHRPQERYLTGVYTSAELNKFLELGGRIIHVHEIWQFEPSTELYADYIKRIARCKLTSSGWPANCVTDEDKQHYLDRLQNENGIVISKDEVTTNKAMRALSKRLLVGMIFVI